MNRIAFVWLVCVGCIFSFFGSNAYASTNGVTVEVALLFDSAYVDTSLGAVGEGNNLKAALEAHGCNVSAFSGVGAASLSNALASADVFVVPELENGNLGFALDPAGVSVISNFVASGHGLIICGQMHSNDESFLNRVFGFSLVGSDLSGASGLTSNAIGTAFADGPVTLAANNGSYEWVASSLPDEGVEIYGFNAYTTVAQIPVGAGRIIFLAYDWYDAFPNGSQDGGWHEVLGNALDDIAITGLAGDLKIVPGIRLIVSGYEGGPFSPTNQVYTLTNIGASNLPWTATATAAWMDVSPTNGVLAAGDTNLVTVSIDSVINSFPPGTDLDTLVFSNVASGDPLLIEVQLDVRERMLDHFVWTPIESTQRVTVAFDVEVVAVDQAGVLFPGFTNTVSLSGLQGEEISPIQSGAFSGGAWTGSVTVLDAATNMVLRADDGAGHTGDSNPFNIDPLMLNVNIPLSTSEGDGLITGEVTANVAPMSNLVVNLVSDDITEATVEASVTILAGQTNATFELQAVDDGDLEGTQSAMITASATNYMIGSAIIQVYDNEVATLTLSLPQTTFEGAGTVAGALMVNPVTDEDVTLDLVSNNPSKVAGRSIVIPAGQSLVSFSLDVIDDNLIDGMQTATISAQVQNWTGSQVSIFIFDNETTVLGVQIPDSAMEGDGTLANAGTVSLSGVATSDIHVTLASSDVTEAVVPASVTISNGQSSATFDITIIDDADTDGMQALSILAQASGFVPGNDAMEVLDNDLYSFTVDGLATNPPVLEPTAVNIVAVNIDGMPMTWFTGAVSLAASGDIGAVILSPTSTTPFMGGAWSGDVAFSNIANNVTLTADDGAGHTGTSSVFNVTGSQLVLTPTSLTNTLVVAGQTFTRTMVVSNAGNADLEFVIQGGGADPVDPSLIAHFPFNGNAADESGNGHDGTVIGATLTTDRFGNANSAYSFDGVNDYIDLGSMGGFKTVSMWVKQRVRNSYDTYFGHDDFRLYASIAESGRLTLGDAANHVVTPVHMDSQMDQWVHIVGVSDGVDSKIYLNGTNVTVSSGDLMTVANVAANLGRMSVTSTHYLNGDIDDVRIYDRILSESEISDLYTEGAEGDADLIASFPFNGNADDESGNGHDGTVNGATLTTNRFGDADSAYLFDGTDDYIEVPDAPDLRLNGTDFTISTWFLESALNSSYADALLSKRGSGTGGNGWINYIGGVRETLTTGRATLKISGGSDPIAISSTVLTLNEWHNSVFVYNFSAQTISIYIDGALDSVVSNMPSPSASTTQNLFISRESTGSTYFFHGVIDDIRIYDRMLSESEIVALYTESDSGEDTGGASWLMVAPTSGTVPPGSNVAVTVQFNAAGMVAGDYVVDLLKITSNDAFAPSNAVPASMYVVPPAPLMLPEPEITTGNSNEVAWSAVNGPVTYWVEVATATNTPATQDSGWIAATNHIFGFTTNAVHYYRVKASATSDMGLLESAWSDWVWSMQEFDLLDVDGDGLPNWWEQLYFGGEQSADPLADPDGDGQSNADEFIAGMNPTNAWSTFMVNTFDSPTNGQFILSWDSVTGRVYSVHWKNSMTNGFQMQETNIRHPQNSYTDSVHQAEDQGFYQIDVELEGEAPSEP